MRKLNAAIDSVIIVGTLALIGLAVYLLGY